MLFWFCIWDIVEEDVDGNHLLVIKNTRGKQCCGRSLFSICFNSCAHSGIVAVVQTDSKLVAERIESQLLLVFDYAWNRGNVRQRSPDILAKIVMGGAPGNRESSPCCFGNGSSRRRWFFFRRKRPGIWIPARRPEGIYGHRTIRVGDGFMRLGGRKGAKTSEFTMLDIPVERCGAILDSGLPCSALPVKGRKRCLMHKNAKRRSQRKPIRVAHTVQSTPPQQSFSFQTRTLNFNPISTSTTAREARMFESCFPFLAPSRPKLPVSVAQESKRRGSISFSTWLRTSELRKSKGTEWLTAMDDMNGIGGGIGLRPRHSTEGSKRSATYQSTLSTWTEAQNEVPASRRDICGLRLDDGTVCKVAPRPDRKRCFAHKGMRNSGLRSPIEIQSPITMPLSGT